MSGIMSQPAVSPRDGRWEHFPHGADIGIRGFGPTLATAFAQAARALTAVITDPDGIARKQTIKIECAGNGTEDLLYVWLNRLVYEMAIRRMIFCEFDLTIAGNRLIATMRGEPISPTRHEPTVEIKGATYTSLKVRETPEGWLAECVVDV